MMFGLHTSRVLLVDDDATDALPILKSLGLHGIGAVYLSGAIGDPVPEQPLSGIRVAILDIYLNVLGDPATRMQQTVQLVDRIVSEDNGPYVAVVWTSNPDDFEQFKSRLMQNRCPPVLMVPLDKSEVMSQDEGDRAAEQILGVIEEAVRGSPAVEFSIQWEQLVHDAATDSLGVLRLGHDTTDRTTSTDVLACLLRSSASAAALESNDGSSRALLAALNPIHMDKLESRAIENQMYLDHAVGAIRSRANASSFALEQDEIVELNTALLFDIQSSALGAGAIYLVNDMRKPELVGALPTDDAVRESTVEKDHITRAVDVQLVLCEVSASCDHQQGNTDVARFVAGIAFDAERVRRGDKSLRVHPRKATYVCTLEAVRTGSDYGLPVNTIFAWNSRFPVSVPAHKIADLMPIGRIREPLLTCIRDWHSHQSSRPGYLNIPET